MAKKYETVTVPKNEIVVYQPNATMRLEVRLEDNTVWLSQQQLCQLFGVVKSNVSYHLKNIFATKELDYEATVQKIRTVQKEGKREVVRVIIDNYIDERVLTLLAERRKGVSCHVYGKNAAKRDVQLAFSRYQQQYPNDGLTLTRWPHAHDRFIVCDSTVWICGSSIKDAGRRMFALVKTGLKPDVVLMPLP